MFHVNCDGMGKNNEFEQSLVIDLAAKPLNLGTEVNTSNFYSQITSLSGNAIKEQFFNCLVP